MSKSKIIIKRDDGVPLYEVANAQFNCSRVDSGASECALVTRDVDITQIGPDAIIEYHRDPYESGTYILDGNAFLVHGCDYDEDSRQTVLYGSSFASILDRRSVVYYAVQNVDIIQNYYTKKTMYADDMAKEIVRQNFSNSMLTILEADIPSSSFSVGIENRIMGFLRVPPNTSAAPIITHNFPSKPVGTVIGEICGISKSNGTQMFYDVIFEPETMTAVFMTWTGMRGIDRRGLGTVLSKANGSLSGAKVKKSWKNEATWAHVGGKGQGKLRVYAPVTTGSKIFRRTMWYPKEVFVDAQDAVEVSEMTSIGRQAIESRAPREIISASAVQVDGARLGVDYGLGDVIDVEVNGVGYECSIGKYEISYNGRSETITVPLQNVDSEFD